MNAENKSDYNDMGTEGLYLIVCCVAKYEFTIFVYCCFYTSMI